jgi:hypothetical protein
MPLFVQLLLKVEPCILLVRLKYSKADTLLAGLSKRLSLNLPT